MSESTSEEPNCCGQWITRRSALAFGGAVSVLAVLAEFGIDIPPAFAADWGPITWPVPSPVPVPNSAYGQQFGAARPWPNGSDSHNGSDFLKPYGTPVFAIAAGTVSQSHVPSCGGEVWITHSGNLRSQYLHLQPPSIAVGSQVSVGQQIGLIGDHNLHNGCSSVDHVHLGITYNGGWIDPYLFLQQGGALPPPNGNDMPTLISSTRSIPGQAAQVLPQMSWATLESGAAWPSTSVLIYNTTTATNPAELAPSATVFEFALALYVSNLPAGEIVGVRMGLQNKSTGAISGLGSMTFGDSNSGKARGQYTGQLSINQSTYRAVIQAYSSAVGVSLDTLAMSALAW